jgi:threonyl-tRNA synthetase
MKAASAETAKIPVVITLPDGKKLTFEGPVTGADIAAKIGPGLAKAALAVKQDGELIDLQREIKKDSQVAIITRRDPEALELIRHDAAHVMAEAVQELFPGTQVTIGPAIENGYYYDFARDTPFTTEDFEKIEKKMREIIARNEPFVREVWSRDEAIKHFTSIGEKYKAEIIKDLPASEEISVYRQGKWYDLCRGPHLPTTGHVGTAFKLMKVAGAYWRGDAKNAMLTRIYGTAWRDQKELDAHLHMLEEAEKRDHRKIGKEMDLFHLQEEAVGSVFWHDKGYAIYRTLENFIRRKIQAAGYQEVKTPQLFDSSLFKASGHWDIYGDNMFKVKDTHGDGEKMMGLKPMNCPAHVQIFNQGIKSYRDLPIRMAEFGCCHRNEPSGAMHGIMRVRQFTQDDAHIFCAPEQMQEEAARYFKLQLSVYKDLGFDKISVKLALRPGPNARIGSDELWDWSENALREALKAADLPFEELPGEGAFYGPKVEFHLTDAIGRTWQCGTLQVDPNLPNRLDANFIGEDGQKHRPIMLHRAILGSMERFIGILIENYAGKLPLWLAPVQAVVATITSDADVYATKVQEQLKKAGIRAEIDLRNEKINYKIREHSLAKIQQIWVVGKREGEEQTVAIRRLGGTSGANTDIGAQEILALDEAIRKITVESAPPA